MWYEHQKRSCWYENKCWGLILSSPSLTPTPEVRGWDLTESLTGGRESFEYFMTGTPPVSVEPAAQIFLPGGDICGEGISYFKTGQGAGICLASAWHVGEIRTPCKWRAPAQEITLPGASSPQKLTEMVLLIKARDEGFDLIPFRKLSGKYFAACLSVGRVFVVSFF